MAKTARQNEQTVVLIGTYAYEGIRCRCTIYNLEDVYFKCLPTWKDVLTNRILNQYQWNTTYSLDQIKAIAERERTYLKDESVRTFPYAFLT